MLAFEAIKKVVLTNLIFHEDMTLSNMRLRLTSRIVIQGLFFTIAMALVYWLFRDGRWDNWVTARFFDPDNLAQPWTQQSAWWVVLCYKGVSILTGLLGLSIIGCFIAGFYVKRLRVYRTLCVFMFFLLALGPGLVVNGVLKDNWGRPRPRDTVEFNGNLEYQAPFVISDQGGKSFPCGHCSVAFAFVGIGFWLRERSRRWFWFILIFSLLSGLVVGLARVAVGAHYLSDVLVSGLVIYLTTWLLVTFFPGYCLPREESTQSKTSGAKPWQKRLAIAGAVVLLLLVLTAAMLAFPFSRQQEIPLVLFDSTMSENDLLVVLLKPAGGIVADTSPIGLEPDVSYVLQVQMNGFGFPWSDAEVRCETEEVDDVANMLIHLKPVRSGFFTELNTKVVLERSDP